MGRHAETRGEGTLRVEVDGQHAAAVLGERRAQVDGGRRLADAALLVAEGDDPGGAVAAQGRGFGELTPWTSGGTDEQVVEVWEACPITLQLRH